MVTHEEKIWSVKKAFVHGTCYFPLLKRYPHETLTRSRPIAIGLLLTLGVIAELFLRLPVVTLSFLALFIAFNGITPDVSAYAMLTNGLYTTSWALSYYLGALYGGLRTLLSLGRSRSET